MANDWEFELKELQASQADLRRQLAALDERVAQLQASVSAVEKPAVEAVPEEFEKYAPRASARSTSADIPEVPPPLMNDRRPGVEAPFQLREPSLPSEGRAVSPTPPLPSPDPAEGLEMKVGKYWLVRIGILVLLTGFVLLANLAYQSFIANVGAAGKLALMFLAGAGLFGIGFWLEKRAEKVRNYARVLMAGGAAAIYYTVYAAHFVSSLRVIEDPVFAGALLLGMAGAFAWFAERRRSEGTAFAAIFLSYYTSAINPAAPFTLFSNILLTLLAAFLLIRHRWFKVTWLALVGSYASFAYWRFFGTDDNLWATHGFLVAYWIIFTLAVFLNRASAFPVTQRGFFLTANNAAFFALAAPTVARWFPQQFWLFCFGCGFILLGLAALAWWVKREEPGFDGTYLGQGLLMLTLGFVTKFSGYDLAIILMVESLALLFLSRFRHAGLFQIFAALAAIASFAMALVQGGEGPSLLIAGLLLFNAWHFKFIRRTLTGFRFSGGAAVYVLPSFVLGAVVLVNHFDGNQLILALSFAAIALTVIGYFLRLPEVAFFAQGFLVGAFFPLLWSELSGSTALPFIGITLALLHAWKWRQAVNPVIGKILEVADSLMVMTVLYVWVFSANQSPEIEMLVGAGIGLAALLYGWLTRAWILAVLGQVFTITGVWTYLSILLIRPEISWTFTLGALILIAGQAAALRWIPDGSTENLKHLRIAYRAGVVILALIWMERIFPESLHFFLLTLGAFLLFIPAALRRNREYLVYAGAVVVIGFLEYLFRLRDGFVAYNLLALILLLGFQQIGKSLLASTGYFPRALQMALVVIAGLGIWIEASRWHSLNETGFALTLVWAVLAFGFLGAGFLLRERAYRLMGLGILTVAVGHVFLVDVWKMGQLAGILGMFGLAGILLLIGYIYNRFAEQIKKWL